MQSSQIRSSSEIPDISSIRYSFDHDAEHMPYENISKEKNYSAEIKNEKNDNFYALFVDRWEKMK